MIPLCRKSFLIGKWNVLAALSSELVGLCQGKLGEVPTQQHMECKVPIKKEAGINGDMTGFN